MRAVIQRVKSSAVKVNEEVIGEIQDGLLILLGVEELDLKGDIDWLCRKILNMRIFADENGQMNLSVTDVNGGILIVSQFTLHASTKKGNRPSFIQAANPEFAKIMYEQFKTTMTIQLGKEVQSGSFGANMQVSLLNNGPVTILLDTKNKE